MRSVTRRSARWRATVAGLATVLAASTTLVAAPAAAQEFTPTSGDTGPDAGDCLPAGGLDVPYDADPAKVGDGAALVLGGGGWGHGVGMSQYGAHGAALLGCTTETILSTYYPGTGLGVMPTQRDHIAVHLLKRGYQPTTIRTTGAGAGGGELPWVACDLTGTACDVAVLQPPGTEWDVTPLDDGSFSLTNRGVNGASCLPSGPEVAQTPGCHWRGGDIETRLRMVHDGTVIRVLDASGRRVKWGFTEFDHSSAGGGTTYVTQYVTGDPDAGVTALDRYLYGLAEMPSSWQAAALRTQAIAGRSYAEATIATRESVYGRHPQGGYIDRNECRCDLFATTFDQVYVGFDHEDAETGKWKQAVLDTRATVMLFEDAPVAAFYSSSHGGWSEDVEHVWGSKLDYLPAVDTSRWEAEVADANTRDRWTATFSASDLAARFGLAEFSSFSIDKRGPGGRPSRLDGGGVTVRGRSSGGADVTIRLSGESLRSKLSLFSSLAFVDGDVEPTGEEPEEPQEQPDPPTPGEPIDISPACPEDDVPEDNADDVPEGSVHEAATDCIVWWGVDAIDEDGNFEGSRDIRRDEMAAWLFRILERSDLNLPEDPPNAFSDDDGNPHEFAINTLAYLAFVNGVGDGKYDPEGTVSRAQMAVFWVRLVERIEGEDLSDDADPFTDDDGTAHEDKITKLWSARVTAGKADGRYDPGGRVTRAQMSSFAARVLARFVEGGHYELPSED